MKVKSLLCDGYWIPFCEAEDSEVEYPEVEASEVGSLQLDQCLRYLGLTRLVSQPKSVTDFLVHQSIRAHLIAGNR